MRFTEQSAIEQGFAPVFEAEVRPKLLALETKRRDLLRRAMIGVAIAIGITAVIMLGIGLIWGGDSFFGFFFVGILGAIGVLGAWAFHASTWTSSVESAVMPAICAHVGNIEFDSNGGTFPIDRMRALGLLPGHDSASLADKLWGTHNDTAFELVQATLSRRGSTSGSSGQRSSRTVFSGLLFHIAVPVDSPGRIVLTRDRGGFGNKLGEMFSFGGARSMPKVEFDHAAFEAAFEVYAEQPDAARSFMPDPLLDALLDIGEEHGGRRGTSAIVAGFEDRSFYMALRRSGGFMQMGKLTRAVTDMEDDLHGIFDDIALIHRIIDRLHGA